MRKTTIVQKRAGHETSTNVKVAIRCRPMSSKETARNCTSIVDIEERSVCIRSPPDKPTTAAGDRDFTFDYCYDFDSSQEQVYIDIGEPIIKQALEGFNCTVFAYGQTGSGKSHSMMGNDADRGIIPRLNDGLWEKVSAALQKGQEDENGPELAFLITVSFLEIYNEQIKDLLNPSKKQLEIREDLGGRGIYVEDLCELVVKSAQDVLKLIEQGNTVRRVAATKMNDQSSRSHSCFTIKIEQRTTLKLDNGKTRETTVKAKLNLVDLAGSERADKTGATGSVLKEGANINKSLMALGNVINALSEGTGAGPGTKHIPYRDSKLTRLLQESLGGNASTVMLAAISPADYNYDETLGTLKYANRAKSIANAVVKNEDESERMITDLKKEIEALRAQLAAGGDSASASAPAAASMTASPGNSPEQQRLEQQLRAMEEEQRNAWEEKERLSKALEDERQANMNAAISTMMATMKEEKLHAMKTIKKLTNEKAALSKTVKDSKELQAKLKPRLDANMKNYMLLQKRAEESDDAAAVDAITDELHTLMTQIEQDRAEFLRLGELHKVSKLRMTALEEELTDERAELVSTAGLLEQNDKIRSQIQEEERKAAQAMIETELAAERLKMQRERESHGKDLGTIEAELAVARKANESLTLQLGLRDRELDEAKTAAAAARSYADQLEERISSAEAEAEGLLAVQQEVTHLKEELSAAQADGGVGALVSKLAEAQARAQELEKQGFDMFATLMDRFREEQAQEAAKLHEARAMLGQAANDIAFLQQHNAQLSRQLKEALAYEPKY